MDDLFNDFVMYLFWFCLWIFMVYIGTHIFSNQPTPAFIVAFAFGGPFMYISMYIMSMIISQFYVGINLSISNEERLEILYLFIYNILLPICVIGFIIGYLIQLASQSQQLKYIINWKSFTQLVVIIIIFYTMFYHIQLRYCSDTGKKPDCVNYNTQIQ
eukprot:291316_1